MKIADFRIQTGVPDAPSTSVVGVYADASGRLIAKTSTSSLFQVGTQLTGIVANSAITPPAAGTGMFAFQPTGWMPLVGPNNEKYAVPLFRYV